MANYSTGLTSNAKMMRKGYRRMLSLLMAICLTVCAFAQNMTVTGIVTSKSDNMPLPGVNVVEAGTTNGTITDFETVDKSFPDYMNIINKLGGKITINNLS